MCGGYVCRYVNLKVVGVGWRYAKQSKLPPIITTCLDVTPFTENPGRRINLISVDTVCKHVTHSSSQLDSSCLIPWQYSRQYQLAPWSPFPHLPLPSHTLTVNHPPFPAITTPCSPLPPSSLLPPHHLPRSLSVDSSYWLSLTRSPAACRPH